MGYFNTGMIAIRGPEGYVADVFKHKCTVQTQQSKNNLNIILIQMQSHILSTLKLTPLAHAKMYVEATAQAALAKLLALNKVTAALITKSARIL